VVCGNFRAQNIWSVVVCGIQADPYQLTKHQPGGTLSKIFTGLNVMNIFHPVFFTFSSVICHTAGYRLQYCTHKVVVSTL